MHKIRNILLVVFCVLAVFGCAFIGAFFSSGDKKHTSEKKYDDIGNKYSKINDEISIKDTVLSSTDKRENDKIKQMESDLDNAKLNIVINGNTELEGNKEDKEIAELNEDDVEKENANMTQLSEEEQIDKKIEDIISHMTTEEKVGQLFFIKDDGRFGAEILKDYPVGGIILFKGDFKSGDMELVKNNIKAFQDETKIPLFIGTDEEGGSVVRLSYYSGLCNVQFNSPRVIYELGGYDGIVSDTELKSDILLDYGINVNFAPVCDYSNIPGAFMYSRSFGTSVDATCVYVEKVVTTMKNKKIGSVMKHFPGYGNNGDTHTNVIEDNRSYDSFVNNDFKPFIAGAKAGADCILVSHNIVTAIDPKYPASLSTKMNNVIRNEIGFEGVVITDDLMMSGVANLYTKEEVAVMAILAGNDMILSTDFWTQYHAVLEATKNGKISVKRLDDSIRKILKWKMSIGIL